MLNMFFFFLMFLSMYFWWVSQSSSVSLLMVLVFSSLSALYYSFYMEMKIPLFMIVLVLSGGLFILVSFVIMFFPGDYKVGVIYFRKMFFFFFFFFFLSFILSFLNSSFCLNFLSGGDYSVMKVWMNFIFVYLFLISLLFLFLFLVNCVVNPSTGSIFFKSNGMKWSK